MKQWPKLHRAFELRDELAAWSAAHASGPEYETRSNPAESSNPTVTMEWRVKRGSLPDYQHAALLLGDIVHNWRSALDHQLWGDHTRAGSSTTAAGRCSSRSTTNSATTSGG